MKHAMCHLEDGDEGGQERESYKHRGHEDTGGPHLLRVVDDVVPKPDGADSGAVDNPACKVNNRS